MDWFKPYKKQVSKAPTAVKAAFKRFEDDLKAKKWVYDDALAQKAIKFIELMPHTKGKWASAGAKLRLEPWQKFIVANIFGWVDGNGKRRFREVYVQVPRKNGKSALAAAIGLYMLVADGEKGAEVYSGATNLPQAKEVFKPAWIMMQKYDLLRTKTKTELYGTSANPSQIYSKNSQSVFKPLKGKPGDGSSPHCAIIDEYHEHPDTTMYDAMQTGMGAREQPLLFIITTAGTRTDGPCYAKYKEAKELLSGVYENDRLFTLIYEVDEQDDPFDIKSVIKANPNYGISVMEDYLQMQLDNARNKGGQTQTIYMIKHLNKWVSAKSAWMNMAKWSESVANFDDIRDVMETQPTWVGLDLGSRSDITAMQFLTYDEANDTFYTFGRYYLPEGAIERAHSSVQHLYEDLVHKGHVIVTPGDLTDYDYILKDLQAFDGQFRIDGVGYDKWGAEILYANLVRDGWESRLVQFAQTTQNRSNPMKEIEGRVLAGQLKHDNNPAMNWMVSNVVAKPDANDNIVPRKDSHERKIDAVDAMIIAMGMALNDMANNNISIDDILFL